VTVSRESEGVIAKLDLVEARDGSVQPVDYKRGSAPDRQRVPGGVWPADRVQVAAQRALGQLKRLAREAERAASIESLLGVEGSAAHVYFQAFPAMLTEAAAVDGLRVRAPEPPPAKAQGGESCRRKDLRRSTRSAKEAMSGWTIRWDGDRSAAVRDLAELDATLDRLASDHPGDQAILAEVVAPSEDSLSVGLGREESVLSFVSASGDPPYYTSLGDPAAEGGVSFSFSRAWSEFPRRSLIPSTAAREAVRQFFTTGSRTDAVRWVED